MKKFTIFFILSAVISLVGMSQQPYTVTRLDSTIYKVFEAIATDDGGFIIAGNNHFDPDSNKLFFIARINEAGETIWKKDYPGWTNWISSLIRKSDGNYFIAMDGENYTGFLLETNSEGDSIWSWSTTALGYNRSRLGPIRELPDGTFILAENIYATDYTYPPVESNYYHLNADGSVRLQFDASNVQTYDIEVLSDNEFISAETEHSMGYTPDQIWGLFLCFRIAEIKDWRENFNNKIIYEGINHPFCQSSHRPIDQSLNLISSRQGGTIIALDNVQG